jgi:hypothetical protein
MSNRGFSPVASVALPQGRRNIPLASADAFRAERIRILYLRLDKLMFQRGHRRLELFANIVNLLQNEAPREQLLYVQLLQPQLRAAGRLGAAAAYVPWRARELLKKGCRNFGSLSSPSAAPAQGPPVCRIRLVHRLGGDLLTVHGESPSPSVDRTIFVNQVFPHRR